jgi:hypothetical protein
MVQDSSELHRSFDDSARILASSTRYSPSRVVDQLRKLMDRWVKLPFPKARRAADLIEAELNSTFPERLIISSALSSVGVAAAGVNELYEMLAGRPSSGPLGTEIHQRLQAKYRDFWSVAPRNFTVIQEGFVYGGILPWRTPLAQAARFVLQDGSSDALYMARDRSLMTVTKYMTGDDVGLRDDNVDFTSEQIWEIKPLRSAVFGVGQEFLYRSTYNFYVALLDDWRS